MLINYNLIKKVFLDNLEKSISCNCQKTFKIVYLDNKNDDKTKTIVITNYDYMISFNLDLWINYDETNVDMTLTNINCWSYGITNLKDVITQIHYALKLTVNGGRNYGIKE